MGHHLAGQQLLELFFSLRLTPAPPLLPRGLPGLRYPLLLHPRLEGICLPRGHITKDPYRSQSCFGGLNMVEVRGQQVW